jgi:hypothetical protein
MKGRCIVVTTSGNCPPDCPVTHAGARPLGRAPSLCLLSFFVFAPAPVAAAEA